MKIKPINYIVDQHTQKVMDLCANIIPYFEGTFFSRWVSDYKLHVGYKGDRQKKILPWQTNIFIPLIPAISDTMYSSMYDSKMKFNLLDTEGDSSDETKGKDILLNKAFDYNNNGRDALLPAIKEAIITGKGYIKPFFNNKQEEIIINGVNYGKKIKRPELSYISIFDVFYDYNTSIDDSPFLIERHIMSGDKIKKNYNSELNKPSEEANAYIDNILERTKTEGHRYSNYDYNRVRNILSYEDIIVNNNKDTDVVIKSCVRQRNKSEQNRELETESNVGGSIDHLNNVFGVDFETNKVYEVIKYTDDKNTTVLIDGVKLYHKKEKNQLGKIYDLSFNEMPGTSDSTGISSNIGDLQHMINTLQNMFLDGLKMNTSPMYEQVGGLNQMLGNKNKIIYEPFKIIPTNTAGALKKIEMGLGGFEPVNAVQFLEGMAEKRVGVNEYIIGGQGKVERVSGGVDLIYNQYKSKLMPLTNSVNQAMGRVAKEFLIMYALYYSEQERAKLGLKEKLSIEDLINEENITFQLTSLALLKKEEGIKHLLDNLGAVSNFMGGVNGPNIDGKELVKSILTKEVDIDKLMVKDKPFTQHPQQGMGTGSESLGGEPDLMSMVNNLKNN